MLLAVITILINQLEVEFQAIAREDLRSGKQCHRISIRTLYDRERWTREAKNYWNEQAHWRNKQKKVHYKLII